MASLETAIFVDVTAETLPHADVDKAMVPEACDAGAIVVFEGLCRSEGGALTALELEHYPGMAQKQLQSIADKAASRWPLYALVLRHRYGVMKPGEIIVRVTAASSHRVAAFEAANFVMDFLKTEAPFWKKEHKADGTTGDWVEAKDADDAARDRWS